MSKKRTLNELRQVKTFGYVTPLPKTESHGKLGGNLQDAHMRKCEHDYEYYDSVARTRIEVPCSAELDIEWSNESI